MSAAHLLPPCLGHHSYYLHSPQSMRLHGHLKDAAGTIWTEFSHYNTILYNADDSPKLEVWVQALHVTHRPTCWAALSALTAGGPKDTQSSRVADTANLLNDSKAQTLAQAQRAIKAFLLPTVAVKVRHCIHAEDCIYVTLLIMHLAVSAQPARIQTRWSMKSAAMTVLCWCLSLM